MLLLLIAIVSLPCLLFWPGSSGPFLLDDAVNLAPLANHGGVDSFEDARNFVSQGVSSPLGRPVSLSTFLLNAQTWPAEPAPFKITNILIHSATSGLLFILVLQLMRLRQSAATPALLVAGLAATLWAIHPLQTSTVLYVIQRMTELAALFVLLGILCYLHGRRQLDSQPKAALGWMSAAVVAMGALAVLSKENGILLPLLILITEFTLLHALPRPKLWKWWALPFLVLPSAAIIGYLAYYVGLAESKFAQREFSLFERLLTQSRALMDYLGQFFWPSRTPNLFHDDFVVSSGLSHPVSTAIASAAIIGLIAAALFLRRRLPVLSFAVLWFFAAHLLESSVLSLELYYEHRNYLPLVGPALAVAFYLHKLIEQQRIIGIAASAIVLSLLAVNTWQHSHTWGDERQLFATWSAEKPNSARISMSHIIALMQAEDVPAALTASQQLVQRHPDNLAVRTLAISVACESNTLDQTQLDNYAAFATQAEIEANSFGRFQHLFTLAKLGHCRLITPKHMLYLIDQWLANPKVQLNSEMTMWLHLMTSEVYEALRQIRPTVYALDRAFAAHQDIDILLKKTYLLTINQYFEAAQNTLNFAHELDAERPAHQASRIATLQQAQALINQGRVATQTKTPAK